MVANDGDGMTYVLKKTTFFVHGMCGLLLCYLRLWACFLFARFFLLVVASVRFHKRFIIHPEKEML